jgi:hypothetical protein
MLKRAVQYIMMYMAARDIVRGDSAQGLRYAWSPLFAVA